MTGFAGQWIGRISGSINGTLTLNFDSDRPQHGLLLVAGDHDRNTLFAGNLFCHFLHDKYEFYARDITAVVHTTSPTQIPKVINAQGNFSNNSISATWTSDNKGCGYFEVLRQDESGPTPATIMFDSWDSFQQWIKERRKFESRYVYRGHERNTYRLESSFHRTGRRNVGRYWKEDIPELYRALAPLLTHRFDVTNHIEFTAFLYLARHHGCPTPLLDWTASH